MRLQPAVPHQISHNVKVSMRGQCIDGGKEAQIVYRKLYLHPGGNKHYVSSAYREIKRTMEEMAYEGLQMCPLGRYSICN